MGNKGMYFIKKKNPGVTLGIFSFSPADKTMCSEVNSASNNEYQGFLLG